MRGVAYFNDAVKFKSKKLSSYFAFMQPESGNAPRVVKLRLLNNAYKLFHV